MSVALVIQHTKRMRHIIFCHLRPGLLCHIFLHYLINVKISGGGYRIYNVCIDFFSNEMRWVGHVARMGEERGCIGSFWGNRREGDHRGDLGVDGWITLGLISRRWDVGMWTELGWPRIETGDGRL